MLGYLKNVGKSSNYTRFLEFTTKCYLNGFDLFNKKKFKLKQKTLLSHELQQL